MLLLGLLVLPQPLNDAASTELLLVLVLMILLSVALHAPALY